MQWIKIQVYSRSPRAFGNGGVDWQVLNEDMNTTGILETWARQTIPGALQAE